jgi:AcrR family transcriptional regulator
LSGLTTNAVAARAGVGIGSLYDFFPTREAVVTALAQQRLEALRQDVEAALDEALRRSESDGLLLLLTLIVDRVVADRALFRALLREAPFLREVPEIQRAIGRLFDLGPLARERARNRTVSLEAAGETWLMSRMLAGAALDIAFADADAPARKVLVRELARLGFRMFAGRDPNPPQRTRKLRRTP